MPTKGMQISKSSGPLPQWMPSEMFRSSVVYSTARVHYVCVARPVAGV